MSASRLPHTVRSPRGAVDREQILTRLRERILAFAASRLQKEEAEDLAQEVLVVLEEKYRQVEALHELVPLSFQILRFKMAARVRKRMRRGEHRYEQAGKMPLADPGENPEEAAARRERQERLKAALLRLDGRCRELFRLKLSGKTFPEIQGILGANSVNTVYTWDARCRNRLLALMGGTWEAER